MFLIHGGLIIQILCKIAEYLIKSIAASAALWDPELTAEEEGEAKAVAAVQQRCLDVGLPRFKFLNVPEQSFGRIAKISARNISTQSNPGPMTVEDYIAVLKMANR